MCARPASAIATVATGAQALEAAPRPPGEQAASGGALTPAGDESGVPPAAGFLTTAGCRKIFADKKSGKNALRPELKACHAFLDTGDTLVVPSPGRYGRSLHRPGAVSARSPDSATAHPTRVPSSRRSRTGKPASHSRPGKSASQGEGGVLSGGALQHLPGGHRRGRGGRLSRRSGAAM
ncbi:recombinase family protein [Streptomyces subrutilus]|uniref:recombinase family protein n=1 Tax=Streptomyces subrutilus TaxID=36818 RepID=UPI002E108ED3|nr:recombinase family protein [Streptomyces subrutilus]